MNKTELAAAVAEKLAGSESDARQYVDTVFETIMQRVAAGERVQVTGFGTFDQMARAARTGRNPRTGALIQLAASASPRFHAGQTFRAQVAATPAATPAVVVVVEAQPAEAKAARTVKVEKTKPAKTVKAEEKKVKPAGKKAAKPATATAKAGPAKKAAKSAPAAEQTGPAKKAKAAAPVKTKKAGKK